MGMGIQFEYLKLKKELSEGFGIISESMKQYAKIRDSGLAGIKKMEAAN